jgi:hypothetical protein
MKESLQLLKDYEQEIKETSLWIYSMPYSKLNPASQRAIRQACKETMYSKIYDMTENK